MAEPKIVYRYNGGGGGFIPRVPRRDLTEDDVKALPADVLRDIAASSLYTPVKSPATSKDGD